MLPTEFGLLEQLSWLALYESRLGELPTEFGQLTLLTWLALHNNRLDLLPTEFGQLTELTQLDLHRNRLDVLPTEFGQLTELTQLDLHRNSLDVLPTEFGQLTRITHLDLNWNGIDELPTEFGQLSEVTYLNLYANSMEALPTEFGLLTNVTWLDIDASSLRVLPTEFGQLTRLTHLDLKRNYLEVLVGEIGLLTQLTLLDLYGNNLETLTTEIGQLSDLSLLKLDNNDLEITPTQLGLLKQLIKLELDENNLKELPTQIGNLESVTQIDLNSNALELLPSEVGQLSALSWLSLQKNKIKLLPTEFGQLANLTWLSLDANSLDVLPTEFGQLTQLSHLNLDSNSIETLPTEFGQLTKLTSLSLKGDSLKVLPSEFGQLTQLTDLKLDSKNLKELPFRPTNLSVTFVRSASIDVTWLPPSVPLTAVAYQARVTSAGITRTYPSLLGQAVLGINLLQKFPNLRSSTFTIEVMAQFKGDYSSPYSKPLNVTTCPDSMERENTNDVKACYALAGFYTNGDGFARRCTELESEVPPGAIGHCLSTRLTVQTLPIEKGFWRANLNSEDIRMCPDAQFCTHQRSNLSFISPDQYCAPFHAGIYCSDCVKDYVLGEAGCTFCTKKDTESKEQLVLIIFVFLFLLLVLYIYVLHSAGCFNFCRRRGSERRIRLNTFWKSCKEAMQTLQVGTKIRILLGYFQVLSSYRRTFLKQSLTDGGDLLGVMALLSNVDLTWLVGNAAFRCVHDYDHYDILLVTTLSPIVLALLLFVCTSATVYYLIPRLMRSVRHHTASALLFMLFLIYPYVSQTVLGTFWCESFPDADVRFNLTTSALRADYRLSCEHDADPERLGFEIYAGIMLVVYPVGVVLLYSSVLLVHRARVMAFHKSPSKENREKLTKVLFLIKPYKVERFWYEAFELIRKLIQTSFVGFLADASIQKELPAFLGSISEVLTIIFVLTLALLRPYKHKSDFAFAIVSLLLLIPASQYSMLDPYARHGGINQHGLEALVITELLVFALFVFVEFGLLLTPCRENQVSCAGSSCKRKRGLRDSSGSTTQNEATEELPLVAKKKIAELEESLKFFKAENHRMREAGLPQAYDATDSNKTSIQPI